MSEFHIFKKLVDEKFKTMANKPLFTVKLDRDVITKTYLEAFEEGTNPLYRERTEHDCSCCKAFIRNLGSVVTINDDLSLDSIWNLDGEIHGIYKPVAAALHQMVINETIKDVYRHYENHVGTDLSHERTDDGIKEWKHFYTKLPSNVVINKKSIPKTLGDIKTNFKVLKRALDEISLDAIKTVDELIQAKNIYRGEDYRAAVSKFVILKTAYLSLFYGDNNFVWLRLEDNRDIVRIRNTAIGTLLVDITNEMDLEEAVNKFQAMVAPSNFKRSSALVTKAMIEKARDTIEELNLTDALERRYSVIEDVSINNVLFADASAAPLMDKFDALMKSTSVKTGKVPIHRKTVSIEDFMDNVLPNTTDLEVEFNGKHTGNLMSLLSPVNLDSGKLFKWDNNFSFSYNGDVTDSMKQRVKEAGGKIDGDLRFSIQWNDGEEHDQNDLDAHCVEPNRNLVYYSSPTSQYTNGKLDVDIQRPSSGTVAVENITWADRATMPDGPYEFLVHQYSHRGGRDGVSTQIEFDGVIYDINYPKNIPQGMKVHIATVTKKGDQFTIAMGKDVVVGQSNKEIWSVTTNQFHKVNAAMLSPNYWDHQSIGNKHWFFIIEGCNNPGETRGFYNEFLRGDLHDHRKVFEHLSGSMKAPHVTNQLSGLGFSSTKRDSLLVKADSQLIEIKF